MFAMKRSTKAVEGVVLEGLLGVVGVVVDEGGRNDLDGVSGLRFHSGSSVRASLHSTRMNLWGQGLRMCQGESD
jgi:hypothetical protein